MSRKRTIDAFFGAAAPKPKKPRDANTGSLQTPRDDDPHLDGLNTSSGGTSDKEPDASPPPPLLLHDGPSVATEAYINQTTPKALIAVVAENTRTSHGRYSRHPAYPFPIPHLPPALAAELPSWPASLGRAINDQPDLDLVYFEPYVARRGGNNNNNNNSARSLFEFLRSELPFYRVEYDINRGGTTTHHVRTPRWTTVFGLDATSLFSDEGEGSRSVILDAKTGRDVSADKFYTRYQPRPIPQCLDALRRSAQEAAVAATTTTTTTHTAGAVGERGRQQCEEEEVEFNFCLVNYYASGADSISFHSDDERFLGPRPAIASFSLGARRDFLLKHKPTPPPPGGEHSEAMKKAISKPLKLSLASGDMVLMRGATQANWLHSIPKRTGKNANDGGRINITFRRAMIKPGTDNYYNYNVGTGPVYKWDPVNREMRPWKKDF